MLSTFPADESKGEMVVLVSDGKGEELCDGDGADDMTWHNDVRNCMKYMETNKSIPKSG